VSETRNRDRAALDAARSKETVVLFYRFLWVLGVYQRGNEVQGGREGEATAILALNFSRDLQDTLENAIDLRCSYVPT
jgi:hypothetical protein